MGIARISAAAFVVAFATATATAPAQAQSITPQGFGAGFAYPLPAATINGWVNTNNQTAIRARAWALWGAMGAPSGQIYNGANLPIWETWWGNDELFPGTCGATAQTAANRQPTRPFANPNQFSHLARGGRTTSAQSDAQVVSFNKFNGDFGTFVRTPQQGPAGPGNPYCYSNAQSMTALTVAWANANTPTAQRQINGFPAAAIATKPVMGLVKQSGVTVLPMWQGPGRSTRAQNPTPDTWTSCVVIDPTMTTIPATAPTGITKPAGLSCQRYSWALLSQLYSFQMSAGEATAFNNAQAGGASAGDYAVLLAMHVTTKEIPFWTWQTFYWQPIGDTPNRFPGSKANQPATLPSPWNNYAMCTAYSQNTPFGSSRMTVCFNPYLETSTGIPSGLTSNCMSCHGVAQTGPRSKYPAQYLARIPFFTDPTYYPTPAPSHFGITDFSWATANVLPN